MSNKLRICTEYAVRTLLLHCIEISKKSKNNCKRVHQIICVYIYTRVWCEHFTPNECSCRASSSAVCFVIKTQLNRSSRPRRAHLLGVVLLRLFACFKSALCSRFRCHHRTLWIFQVHRVKTVVTTCESQANRKPLHHTAAENEMFIHRLNTTPVLIQRSIWTQTRAHTASQLFFHQITLLLFFDTQKIYCWRRTIIVARSSIELFVLFVVWFHQIILFSSLRFFSKVLVLRKASRNRMNVIQNQI